MGITSEFYLDYGVPTIQAKRGNLVASFQENMAAINIEDYQGGRSGNIEYNAESTPPPMLVDGRFYVPVMYITDAFGAKRVWDGATKTVVITE